MQRDDVYVCKGVALDQVEKENAEAVVTASSSGSHIR